MVASAFGFLAALCQVVGYVIYYKSFRDKSIRPNAASFFMFAYGTAFIFFLEMHGGATWPMLLLPGACALMGIVIAIMCLRRGATEPTDKIEKATFGVDVVLTVVYGTALYYLGKHPAYALPFLLAGNATTLTSFLPLLRSTHAAPTREKATPWLVWSMAYAFLLSATILDGGFATPVLLIYPGLNLFLHLAVAYLSTRPVRSNVVFRDGSFCVLNRPSSIHGLGMFAGRNYRKGEEIWVLKGRPVIGSLSASDPNAVGFAPNMWIDPEPPFECVNHSCEPNAAFGPTGEFYALRAIAKGEEIAMDYSTTEADPEWKMDCSCGAANCRKKLRAIQIAFADSTFPPPAAPGMQMVWRDYRMPAGADRRTAFPQIGKAESLERGADQQAVLPDGTDG
jgi:uncharacterized membrane protein YecN with MAPEG domain